MTLLADYAITPDVFDVMSYPSEDACEARLELIREPMLTEGVVRDLRNGEWRNSFENRSRTWHRRGLELVRKTGHTRPTGSVSLQDFALRLLTIGSGCAEALRLPCIPGIHGRYHRDRDGQGCLCTRTLWLPASTGLEVHGGGHRVVHRWGSRARSPTTPDISIRCFDVRIRSCSSTRISIRCKGATVSSADSSRRLGRRQPPPTIESPPGLLPGIRPGATVSHDGRARLL